MERRDSNQARRDRERPKKKRQKNDNGTRLKRDWGGSKTSEERKGARVTPETMDTWRGRHGDTKNSRKNGAEKARTRAGDTCGTLGSGSEFAVGGRGGPESVKKEEKEQNKKEAHRVKKKDETGKPKIGPASGETGPASPQEKLTANERHMEHHVLEEEEGKEGAIGGSVQDA